MSPSESSPIQTGRPAIWLMDMDRYDAVDGPFYSLEGIPRQIYSVLEEDPDYSLQVWTPEQVNIKIRENPWWREYGDG